MHVQITDRCNMTCGHCSFACTTKGSDMTFEDFKLLCDLPDDSERLFPGLVIGGGEPTLHKQLFEFIDYAYERLTPKGIKIFMTTNGAIKKSAIKLHEMAVQGKLSIFLSLDQWHDPIDQEVVDLYSQGAKWLFRGLKSTAHSKVYIRTMDPDIVCNQGRCDFGNPILEQNCSWARLFVLPNGNIKYCGCPDSKIVGTVKTGVIIDNRLEMGCKSPTGTYWPFYERLDPLER